MADLLPCPFGCNAGHDQPQVHVRDVGLGKGKAEWRVCCDHCSAKGPTAIYKVNAIRAWNQRSALAALRSEPPTQRCTQEEATVILQRSVGVFEALSDGIDLGQLMSIIDDARGIT